MEQNNILNMELLEKRKNFQKERVEKLRKISNSNLESDILLKKNSNKQLNSQYQKDNSYTNDNINQSLEKYKKEIIGNKKEEKIIPNIKINNQNKEEHNYQDNSIILKQAYNEKLKSNTQEIKELLSNKNN